MDGEEADFVLAESLRNIALKMQKKAKRFSPVPKHEIEARLCERLDAHLQGECVLSASEYVACIIRAALSLECYGIKEFCLHKRYVNANVWRGLSTHCAFDLFHNHYSEHVLIQWQ
jgi:hypothetical protein